MSKSRRWTKEEKAEVMEMFNIIAPCTMAELRAASGWVLSYCKEGLRELRRDGLIFPKQIGSQFVVWFHEGEQPSANYKHVSKHYTPDNVKREPVPVAGPRIWQAGTTEKLVWKGWPEPARPGAMDAYKIPSRGFA